MQFNWPALEDVPDILQALADVDMHAIQTSGSCIRNVTTDQFAGAAADETIDPRPFCELLRQWSTSHPEFEWLPRKVKIAVTGAAQDRAAIGVHDIGMRIHGDDNHPEDALIDIYAGGGLGRTPVLGALIRQKLPAKDLLTYTEALMRVYNRYGRRDNKYKARIKILVEELGLENYRDEVKAEVAGIDRAPFATVEAEYARIKDAFGEGTPGMAPGEAIDLQVPRTTRATPPEVKGRPGAAWEGRPGGA